MRSKIWLAAGLIATTMTAAGAHAEDFNFSFSSQGSDENNGVTQVSGVLYGLQSSGSSTPTAVSVRYGGQTFDFMPTGQETSQASGTFTVKDGTITAANFFDDFSDPKGGYQLQLSKTSSLLSGLFGPSQATQTASFQDMYNGKFTDATQGVTYTPVATGSDGSAVTDARADFAVSAAPEPSTWALLMTGAGLVGALLRRRRGAPAAA